MIVQIFSFAFINPRTKIYSIFSPWQLKHVWAISKQQPGIWMNAIYFRIGHNAPNITIWYPFQDHHFLPGLCENSLNSSGALKHGTLFRAVASFRCSARTHWILWGIVPITCHVITQESVIYGLYWTLLALVFSPKITIECYRSTLKWV